MNVVLLRTARLSVFSDAKNSAGAAEDEDSSSTPGRTAEQIGYCFHVEMRFDELGTQPGELPQSMHAEGESYGVDGRLCRPRGRWVRVRPFGDRP